MGKKCGKLEKKPGDDSMGKGTVIVYGGGDGDRKKLKPLCGKLDFAAAVGATGGNASAGGCLCRSGKIPGNGGARGTARYDAGVCQCD